MNDPSLFGFGFPDPDLRRRLLQMGLSAPWVDQHLARLEHRALTLAPLAAQVTETLVDAGFTPHDRDRDGGSGGFLLNCLTHDDGVLVSWALRGRVDVPYDDDPFEDAVHRIMPAALREVLVAAGYTAQLIPDEEDYGGDALVTAGPTPAGPATS